MPPTMPARGSIRNSVSSGGGVLYGVVVVPPMIPTGTVGALAFVDGDDGDGDATDGDGDTSGFLAHTLNTTVANMIKYGYKEIHVCCDWPSLRQHPPLPAGGSTSKIVKWSLEWTSVWKAVAAIQKKMVGEEDTLVVYLAAHAKSSASRASWRVDTKAEVMLQLNHDYTELQQQRAIGEGAASGSGGRGGGNGGSDDEEEDCDEAADVVAAADGGGRQRDMTLVHLHSLIGLMDGTEPEGGNAAGGGRGGGREGREGQRTIFMLDATLRGSNADIMGVNLAQRVRTVAASSVNLQVLLSFTRDPSRHGTILALLPRALSPMADRGKKSMVTVADVEHYLCSHALFGPSHPSVMHRIPGQAGIGGALVAQLATLGSTLPPIKARDGGRRGRGGKKRD